MSKVLEARKAYLSALRWEISVLELGTTQVLESVNDQGAQAVLDLGQPSPRNIAKGELVTVNFNGRKGSRLSDDVAYLAYIRAHPNCRGEDVNKALGITGSQASAVRARLGKQIVRKGKKRGATYSVRGGGK